LASGVSCRIEALSCSSFFRSRPAITTCSKAIAIRRALTDPIEPEAPMTMVLAWMRLPSFEGCTRRMRFIASAAAHSAPLAE
jgi:hypothetical protein